MSESDTNNTSVATGFLKLFLICAVVLLFATGLIKTLLWITG
jgi:hypothetical protein